MSELREFVEVIQDWHSGNIRQLRLIVDNEDADINLGEDFTFVKDSEAAKCFRLGVLVAIRQISKLPFEVQSK